MSATAPAPTFRTSRAVMGTVASVHVYDVRPHAEVERAVDAVFAELDRLEDVFSTFRPHSQISRVNRGELDLAGCDAEVLDVLDACTWLEHESDGAFSARRPDPPHLLDPAGFVKGWATERAAHRLHDAGLASWYVSAGGDLCTAGAPPGLDAWTFGIADPADPSRIVAEIDVPAGQAIATSGTGVRGAHVWHGRHGAVPSPYVSLTVVGPSLTWADALATAAFARGADALAWLARFPDHHACAITPTGEVHAGGALAAH